MDPIDLNGPDPPARDEPDPPVSPGDSLRWACGLAGCGLAAVAVLLVPAGCATMLYAWFGVAPVAAAGAAVGACGRGPLRAAALAVCLPLLVLGAAFWAAVMGRRG